MALKLTVGVLLGVGQAWGQCSTQEWTQAYNGGPCWYNGGQWTIQCPSKNDPYGCGDRLNGNPHLSNGIYSVDIQAVPGNGTNTAFYLYSYGRNNDKTQPWNEIDFEILGKQITPNSGPSRVWTNFWTGFGVQHGQYVCINDDVSQHLHNYTIELTNGDIITWKVDGTTVRAEDVSQYPDMVATISSYNFQAEMRLWGSANNDWPDMGQLSDNRNSFPLNAYFENAKLDVFGYDHPMHGPLVEPVNVRAIRERLLRMRKQGPH